MQLALDGPYTDFIFGMTGNSVLAKLASPHINVVRKIYQRRCRHAKQAGQTIPKRIRSNHEVGVSRTKMDKCLSVDFQGGGDEFG